VKPPTDRARDILRLEPRTASRSTGWARKGFRTGLVALAACLMVPAQVWAAQQRTGGRSRAGGSLVDAPEINPNLWIGLIVLLVGGVLVLTARMRRRAKVG